jgi:hypothetical protein
LGAREERSEMALAQRNVSPILQQADKLFAPLVQEGMFKSYDELIKALLLDYIDRQIASYERQVRAFEKRHGMSFEEYTWSLRGKASTAEEDEWMDWEEVLIFWRKWKGIKRQIADVAL